MADGILQRSALDKIHIRDIALRCVIGVNPEERHEKQDVVIGITLHADLAEAARTDNVENTIDYAVIKKRVARLVEDSAYYLIEALAEAVARECLSLDRRVRQVDVTVEKPGALRFARTVGVEISRKAGD